MNILYICDEYPPGRHGGIGTTVQMLARKMVRMGHTVIVAGYYDWGYGGEDMFEDEGVKVYRFRRRLAGAWLSRRDSLAVRIIYRLLKKSGIFEWDIKRSLKDYGVFLEGLITQYKIDIVEMPDFNEYINFCNTMVPFPALTVPVVVKLHGSNTYFLREAGKAVPAHVWQMEHLLLQQAKAVVGVSKYTADKTAEYLDYHKQAYVLYNGIDTNIDVTGTEKTEGRVVFTGTLVEKKGIYQLAKAWNLVHKELPGATLWVYGKGNIEKIKSCLDEEAQQTVSFKGHVTRQELFRQLAAAQVAVFPSYAECFALAPMEAMACGTAVIYSSRTSGPELIEDGVNGLLANPDDVSEIANNITALLRDRDLCKRIAKRGQIHVNSHFDIHEIAKQHQAFYLQIITQ